MPFKKGQSGNPGGRPKVLADVREATRSHSASALKCLVEIFEDKKVPPSARALAASSILDRGYGKPESKVDATIIPNAVIRAPDVYATVEEWQAKYAPLCARKS